MATAPRRPRCGVGTCASSSENPPPAAARPGDPPPLSRRRCGGETSTRRRRSRPAPRRRDPRPAPRLPRPPRCGRAASVQLAVGAHEVSVIQVDGQSPPVSAQARMTCSNAASTVKRHPARRAARPTLRWGRQASRSKIARGSGDHQVSTGSDAQGKMPALYAVSSVSTSSRPPSATSPFGSDSPSSGATSGATSGAGAGLGGSLASTPASLPASCDASSFYAP